MENNKQISVGKAGMNTDSHPSNLKEHEYTFMLNGAYEDTSGNGFPNLQNEPSNLLCSRFKSGFKVVGKYSDIDSDRVYFLLTNPVTGDSEIGYISSIQNITIIDDVEASCGCDYKRILATPLEEQEQIESCVYTTILSDACNHCLAFDVRYPMRSIWMKNGFLFFTDANNNQRYLDTTDLEQYKYCEDSTCDEPAVSNCECDERCVACEDCDQCPNCAKLKIFKDYSRPCLNPKTLINGGNLKMGTYQFIIALSDLAGNVLTEFFNFTPPVSIFDHYNNVLDQTQLNRETTYGIKLEIEDIDKSFTHYKIVVMQSTAVDGALSFYEVGVFTNSTNEIVYTTDNNKKRISIEEILAVKPKWNSADGMTASGGYLYHHGMRAEKEMNLQPVVILMSAYMRWITGVAKENLYQDGVSDANFGCYLRNEVYPIAIQFATNDGYESTPFPFTLRHVLPAEEEIMTPNPVSPRDSDRDYLSLEAFSKFSCTSTDRTKRWQFYNTANEVIDTCDVAEGTPVVQQSQVKCRITIAEDDEVSTQEITLISSLNSGTANIKIGGVDYLATFTTNLTTTAANFVTSWGAAITTANPGYVATSSTDKIIITGKTSGFPTILAPVNVTTDLSGTLGALTPVYVTDCITFVPPVGYIDFRSFLNQNQSRFCNTSDEVYSPYLCAIISSSETCIPLVSDGVDCVIDPAVISENVVFKKIGGLVTTENPKDLVDYIPQVSPSVCSVYIQGEEQDNTRKLDETVFFANGGVTGTDDGDWDYSTGIIAWVRNTQIANDVCSGAVAITSLTTQGYFLDYQFDAASANLQTAITIDPSCIVGGFSGFLHKKARWFKFDFAGRDKALFEIPTGSACATSSQNEIFQDYPNRDIRFSTYNSCSGTASIDCGIVDLDTGLIYELDRADYASDIVYIAIDAPIETDGSVFFLNPPCGCFSIATRNYEFDNITVCWTETEAYKEMVYNQECTYTIPNPSECRVEPFSYGKFGYWESERNYPANKELYDASTLKVSELLMPVSMKTDFEEHFSDGTVDADGNYVLYTDSHTNLCGQPIRHYKMPGNNLTPYMWQDQLPGFQDSIIFPLGLHIDNEVINFFLDVAVTNGLITQELRSKIVSYKILRGDRTLDKSIIAKGLLYDIYQYSEPDNSVVHYPNYPYNCLGDDVFNFNDGNRLNDIPHPFLSESNNKFTFHSPDTHFLQPPPFLPSELELEGYQFGRSRGQFKEVLDHPKYVLLGQDAYAVANSLALIETTLETALIMGQAFFDFSRQFYTAVGTSSGFNLFGMIGGAIFFSAIVTQTLLSSVMKFGKYRYQWLKTFRDNGTPQNYAYQYSSQGWYNSLRVSDNAEGNLLRGLAAAKYLKGGGRYSVNEKGNAAGALKINNDDRESSLFLSFGDDADPATAQWYFNLFYPDAYKNWDNYGNDQLSASRRLSSGFNCVIDRSFDSNIASPYVSIKNYTPAQYGDINNVRWISTNCCGYLLEDNSPDGDVCNFDMIFGGDTRISRMSLKRKLPFFLVNDIGQADFTPFAYSLYKNIGNTKHFADFDIKMNSSLAKAIFPDIQSDFSFDCYDDRFYISPPSKFYLFAYGIPQFLVESEINLNYRYARKEPHEWFFPNGGATDYIWWTQEKNVSIKYDNEYNYNFAYSRNFGFEKRKVLPTNYNKIEWDAKAYAPNLVIASQKDNYELTLGSGRKYDPWLNYKPFDIYELPSTAGKLISLDDLESNILLARFTNQYMVLNSLDVLRERLNVNNAELGVGIFGQRPIEGHKTTLGHAGTQHKESVSCMFGHFWVDARRGQITRLKPNGTSPLDIAAYKSDGSPSGKRNWFREHLPFKLLKGGIKGLTDLDLDNSYNGAGICMTYDARFKRIFITKKDYIVNDVYKGLIGFEDRNFYATPTSRVIIQLTGVSGTANINVKGVNYLVTFNTTLSTTTTDFIASHAVALAAVGITVTTVAGGILIFTGLTPYFPVITITPDTTDLDGEVSALEAIKLIVSLQDTTYFTESSWTIWYDPSLEAWGSYMSFLPNYYISYQNYFQTGYNYPEASLSSHLLTNKSFGVFSGVKYPWIIELAASPEKYMNKTLHSVEYWLDSKRYHDEYNFAENRLMGFDEAVVFNNSSNSGILKLITEEKNNRYQASQYPKIEGGGRSILQTESERKFTFNSFFNQVRNENNNLPIWEWDYNQINKTINQKAITYNRAGIQERIRGDWFNIRLSESTDSRYKFIFKFLFSNENLYR